MDSSLHLKIKYHNVYDETITISADLFEAKKNYNTMQQDQKEGDGKAMKTNVASMIKKLKDMAI